MPLDHYDPDNTPEHIVRAVQRTIEHAAQKTASPTAIQHKAARVALHYGVDYLCGQSPQTPLMNEHDALRKKDPPAAVRFARRHAAAMRDEKRFAEWHSSFAVQRKLKGPNNAERAEANRQAAEAKRLKAAAEERARELVAAEQEKMFRRCLRQAEQELVNGAT